MTRRTPGPRPGIRATTPRTPRAIRPRRHERPKPYRHRSGPRRHERPEPYGHDAMNGPSHTAADPGHDATSHAAGGSRAGATESVSFVRDDVSPRVAAETEELRRTPPSSPGRRRGVGLVLGGRRGKRAHRLRLLAPRAHRGRRVASAVRLAGRWVRRGERATDRHLVHQPGQRRAGAPRREMRGRLRRRLPGRRAGAAQRRLAAARAARSAARGQGQLDRPDESRPAVRGRVRQRRIPAAVRRRRRGRLHRRACSRGR